MTAVDTTETRNSLSAASLDLLSNRRSATRANAGSDTTSSATTIVRMSRLAASVTAPETEARSRKEYSPAGIRLSRTVSSDSSITTTAPASTSAWNTSVRSSTT